MDPFLIFLGALVAIVLVAVVVNRVRGGRAHYLDAWTPEPARDGTVICFFQAASKFTTRYATLGFSDAAAFDDCAMWPTASALTDLTDAEDARIRALVEKALG